MKSDLCTVDNPQRPRKRITFSLVLFRLLKTVTEHRIQSRFKQSGFVYVGLFV